MTVLADGALSGEAIKTLWLERIPENVRAIVATTKGETERCARQADRIMDICKVNTISAIHSSSTQSEVEERIAKLERAVKKLSDELHQNHRRERSRTPNRNQQSGNRSPSSVAKHPMCYYHYKFGKIMRKAMQLYKSGKLKTASSPAVDEAFDRNKSNRLFIINKDTHLKFLIDTGADFLIVPPLRSDKKKPSTYCLFAANGSKINT